jgi:hypothetical protein
MKPEATASLVPAVHLEFIQNQAGVSEGDGAREVENYHRALFLHHHAREFEQFQQQARIHEERVGRLEARLSATHLKLAGVEQTAPGADSSLGDEPACAWTGWDRTMFVLAGLGVACLLIFGILNISFNLLESGLVTFQENPIRAYFWAALLPVGALAVKVGWDFLESEARRRVYLWASLALGIAGVLGWVAAYATVYPTLSKNTTERIESLTVFDNAGPRDRGGLMGVNSAGAKWIDVVTVGAQAVAEIFLSAVLGMYMTTICHRHRKVRLAGNPLFEQLDEERAAFEEAVARERLALAEARGNFTRLEQQLAALVAFARSMFQKEAALRRDQTQQRQLVLDQISDQLRTQLATVDRGNRTLGNHHDADAVLGSASGKPA